MTTYQSIAQSTADHGRETDCQCPDDRCAGYHHEADETCWCAIFTGCPADDLDDDRRDIAVLGDLDVVKLNRMAVRNRGADPLPISGDAVAAQRAKDHVSVTYRHGQTRTLERSNANGDHYSFAATKVSREERGCQPDEYVQLVITGAESDPVIVDLDLAEVPNVADWFCGLAERLDREVEMSR